MRRKGNGSAVRTPKSRTVIIGPIKNISIYFFRVLLYPPHFTPSVYILLTLG